MRVIKIRADCRDCGDKSRGLKYIWMINLKDLMIN